MLVVLDGTLIFVWIGRMISWKRANMRAKVVLLWSRIVFVVVVVVLSVVWLLKVGGVYRLF